jgi:alpha-tubulin suppressor-like RCC1 family protein
MVPIRGKAIDIDAGSNFSMALTDDKSVWTWGDNSSGQLGTGGNASLSAPSKVSSLKNIVLISCGTHHALTLAENGDLWAWGWNIMGQLGDKSFEGRAKPVKVTIR